jgi:hypothetical protein
MMDLVEEVIRTCGGEIKLQFLDVTHNTIKACTRVSIDANLFPFMEESDKNPRFHNKVTKLFLKMKCVTGVRWIPSEDRGMYLVLSFN